MLVKSGARSCALQVTNQSGSVQRQTQAEQVFRSRRFVRFEFEFEFEFEAKLRPTKRERERFICERVEFSSR